jgi:hypothetical protein
MDFVLDILIDAAIDTLKLVPFLFVTYLIIEAIEHRASEKTEELIKKAGIAGPLVGALVGIFPQCGFSAAASTLYAGRVITHGTLIAVYLATSDEMLPVLLAEQADIALIGAIMIAKLIIGMLMGFLIDCVYRAAHHGKHDKINIHHMCEHDHCGCGKETGGILRSATIHTLQVTFFVFLITLIIDALIAVVGENALASFLDAQPALSIVAAATVGLIPNCAASVVITELFLEGTISTASMMAGLLVSAGIGLLVLFRANASAKQNIAILALLWAIGILWGFIFLATGITFQ